MAYLLEPFGGPFTRSEMPMTQQRLPRIGNEDAAITPKMSALHHILHGIRLDGHHKNSG
jgi:hypothetical protein